MEQLRRLQTSSQKGRWIRWLPLLLLLLNTPSFGVPLIKLSADFTHIDLTNHVDLLADRTQQLSIEQIARGAAANDFAPANRSAAQITDNRSAYWLRFGIDNPLPEARMLALDLRAPDAVVTAAFDGALNALTIHREPLLQLFIPPNSKQLYYLRVQPGGIKSSQLELLSLECYIGTHRAQSWLNGIWQGGIFLIAIVAIVAASLQRDSAYAWLAAYCLTLTVFLFTFSADFTAFLSDHLRYWQDRNNALQIFLPIIATLGAIIALRLPITVYDHRGARAIGILLVVAALTIPLALLLGKTYGTALSVAAMIIATGTTIVMALIGFLQSHRRELLLYALVRMSMLILVIGGSFAWRANSSIREFTDSIIPVVMTLEASGLFAILLGRSVAKQQLLAQDMREIAALEAEARSRTEVVAEVGHRVRTPISGVLGMLDMLQDTSLSTTQLDYLNTIRRASNELLNAIDELSDVSRLQAHTAKVQQNIFDPHALITECVDGFRSAATAHQLELINDLAPELPAYVSGDLTRLRQIILQLLHQTVSQHERGEIVLSVKPLQRDRVHVDIKTRAAIAAITPNEIDRRARSVNSAANSQGSANVRFAIARQLVDMLGGRIQIDDLADGNLHAWFDLELPAVERNLAVTHPDSTLQNKHLLVIDDSVTFCEVLSRQLSHWGMTVFTAHTANEGLARLRNQMTLSQPIDVLLIDTELPELRHGEWTLRLHGEIEPAPIIIFLSSKPGNSAQVQPLESPHLLLKPINHTSLKITLIEAFKQREQRLLPAPYARNEPIRCLFAEDNLINAKVLAGMLDKLGVSYTAANNGQEAVEACRRDRFDIVLMDWDMPVMDGWEASQRIRDMYESRGLPPIPIIALTANTVEELGERARQVVTDAHLVKPIRLQSLRELLEQWTGKLVTTPATSPN